MFAHSQDPVRAVVASVFIIQLLNLRSNEHDRDDHENMLSKQEEPPQERFAEHAVLKVFCKKKDTVESRIASGQQQQMCFWQHHYLDLSSGLVFIHQNRIPSCQSR